MSRARGTTNRNDRGSTKDRAARKRWLLKAFGDGDVAACALRACPECLGTVTFETISVDRHPVPGCEGGRYTRKNIRPGCPPCNSFTGGQLGAHRKAQKMSQTCSCGCNQTPQNCPNRAKATR